ncbi:hypothetical protein ABZP26_08465 [Pseudoalteromonas sp. SD03]|uniref:SGNH hydrolase-type esterase domain-containing protein n=1 Tax=Pseudoalteromonas sp. SD03 TaxID=3231719 RepID=A0AB39AKY6_9GAMM
MANKVKITMKNVPEGLDSMYLKIEETAISEGVRNVLFSGVKPVNGNVVEIDIGNAGTVGAGVIFSADNFTNAVQPFKAMSGYSVIEGTETSEPMYFTYNAVSGNRKGKVVFPDITLTGDFRISYTGTNIGSPIGNQTSFDNVIREDFETIRFGNNRHIIDTTFLDVLKGGLECEYIYKYVIERISNVLTIRVYNPITDAIITQSSPFSDAIGDLYLNSIFGIATSQLGGGAVDLIIEDLTDPASTKNRHYPLKEEFGNDIAVDLISGQNGAWSERVEGNTVEYLITPSGYTLSKFTRLNHHDFDPATQQVMATFSASILRTALLENEALMQFLFAQQGIDLDFHMYARGGETIQIAIDKVPEYLADLGSKGYTPSNVKAPVHIGGNDVSNSLPYDQNKDTHDGIINMRSRLEQYYNLISAEGYDIIWLPISWRNYYAVMPPESNGSLPYNENVVIPFIRDIVGESSYANGAVKYDFYNFIKEEFAKNPAFFSDTVHPSTDIGGPIMRNKFLEWWSPLFSKF